MYTKYVGKILFIFLFYFINICTFFHSHYYGEFHPLTGILYLMLGKIQLHLCEAKNALKALTEADKILRITHGEKHSLFRENLKPLLCQAVLESQQ